MRREETKVVQIGNCKIGGGDPIAIQSMTNTKTEDVEATVAQILALEAAGCDIIRCAVPTMEAAEALTEIKKRIHIPLVDVYKRQLFEVFKYIGVPVDEIGYNQPKEVRYPTENPWR